jgi:hypothetical protein
MTEIASIPSPTEFVKSYLDYIAQIRTSMQFYAVYFGEAYMTEMMNHGLMEAVDWLVLTQTAIRQRWSESSVLFCLQHVKELPLDTANTMLYEAAYYQYAAVCETVIRRVPDIKFDYFIIGCIENAVITDNDVVLEFLFNEYGDRIIFKSTLEHLFDWDSFIEKTKVVDFLITINYFDDIDPEAIWNGVKRAFEDGKEDIVVWTVLTCDESLSNVVDYVLDHLDTEYLFFHRLLWLLRDEEEGSKLVQHIDIKLYHLDYPLPLNHHESLINQLLEAFPWIEDQWREEAEDVEDEADPLSPLEAVKLWSKLVTN